MKISGKQKIRLGLFVLVTGMILIFSLYMIGKKQNLFGNTFKITAVFTNVKGLKPGNNVRYAGINIGTVKQITMVNDSTICVNMVIEETIIKHMKKTSIPLIGSDGLVGSMVVNIFPGDGEGMPLQEGDTLVSDKKPTSADMMSTLSITNQNAAQLSSELLKITKSINEGKGTLGRLVNDREMGEDLKETVENLKNASLEATHVIEEIKQVVYSVNNEENLLHTLVKDSVAAIQFKSIIVNLESSSENINLVINNLNDVIMDVKQGEGAFNYLVSDTILVKDLGETVENIKKGSVMLNENLEALRHNTFFKGYFKKQEKQRLKEERKQQKSQN